MSQIERRNADRAVLSVHCSPADFRISYSGSDLIWSGESRPDLPILHWLDGSVFEPVLLYFGHSAEEARVVESSMRCEAYAIREFFCFLARRGRRWDEATNQLIREWREEQRRPIRGQTDESSPAAGRTMLAAGRKHRAKRPSKHRIERKIAMVVEFYTVVPEAICLDGNHKPFPRLVGPRTAKKGFPITTKKVVSMTPFGPRSSDSWTGAKRETAGFVRKPAPREEGVACVLAELRGRAAARPTARRTRTAGEQSRLGADRDWLMARCQAQAGLRSEEVATLPIAALAEALVEEGIVNASGRSRSDPGLLACPGMDDASRGLIVSGLEDLAAAGRLEIGVEVTCKGRRRKAPFPIALVIDLLEIGLWTIRDAQVLNWSERKPGYVAPPSVFLSFKTGLALEPGSVGGLVKEAFGRVGIKGSAHRLRAYFGNALAQRLLLDRLAINGFVYDASVEKWVLEKVADAMGHARTSTTVAHYVEQGLMRITGATSKNSMAGMAMIQRSLVERARILSDDDFKEIEALIERLSNERRRS